ncbi:MAG: tyrosine-type recombinase/integrase [Syntrophobacteraceae bacterium]
MSIFKRLICVSCGKVSQAAKEAKTAPACPKCGGKQDYSDKWYVSLSMPQANGSQKKITKAVHRNRKVAEDLEVKLKNARIEGEIYESRRARLLFEDAADIFLKWCGQRVREGNLGPRTLEMYEGRLRHNLIPAFKGRDLLKITRDMIEDYKSDRMENGQRMVTKKVGDDLKEVPVGPIAPASINRELATLKRLFSVMHKQGRIKHNPAEHVELLKEDNKRERCLTQEEIESLLRECKTHHLRTAVLIALNTGLRLDGCLSLRWEEIDFTRNIITKRVKGLKEVRIPLTRQLREELNMHRGIAGLVIPSPKKRGEKICRSANIGLDTACRRAGIEDFTFHDLRHTFATHFLQKTRDIHTLAQIMGHSTTHMSERYAHLLEDHKQEQMRIFEEGLTLS